MKVYKGVSASPGLVLGQVSRLEHHVETTTVGPFKPSRELQLLTDAIRTAQDELESMADRAAPSEQAIFQFQSMMLDDEGMMNEVRFCINAGIGAAAAMNQVGQRYADQLANMKDNPYMQLRSVDILDASRRVINIITNRPRMWLALDHPVILAAERLMPTDLFSVPSGMILGIITAEGSGQSHAAIIARAMNIPGIVQVGRDFLDDCDGRTVILDATGGQCTLDPDAAARQQAETRICELQRENEEMGQLHALPNRTKDGQPFELLANCFGPEDIDTAMQSGAQGVGLLRTGYMMLPGRILDEQEQYFFYCSCLAAAKGCPVTVRTFDFGSDRTISDAYQGLQSSKLGLRGIRNSLRQPHQFETQLCALLRAAARGPLRVMFPMVTNVEDWDAAMRVVERCREHLRERGVAFNEDTKFGVMLSVPAACLTAEEFVEHGVDFLVVGTNDLTQYTHAAQQTAVEQAQSLLQAGHHIAAPTRFLAHSGDHIGKRRQRDRQQTVLDQVTGRGHPQLGFQGFRCPLPAIGRGQPAAGGVQPGREHRKVQHRCQHGEYRRAEPCRQQIPAVAFQAGPPADAGGLMQPELLHQQHGHQRAEHAHRQQQLVGRGVAVPEKQQAGIDLQQPRHAEGEQKV